MPNTLTFFGGDIVDGSAGTPGLWDRRFSIISQNLDEVNASAGGGVSTASFLGTAHQVSIDSSGNTLTWSLPSGLTTPGDTKIGGTLHVDSDLSVDSDLTVGGAARVVSTLSVVGAARFGSDVSLEGRVFVPQGAAANPAVTFIGGATPGPGVFGSASDVVFTTTSGSGDVARFHNNYFLVNDTVNDNMSVGVTINQGSFDDHIFTLKSTDISHGLTSATAPNVEVDDWFVLSKQNANSGGVIMTVLAEEAAQDTVFFCQVIGGQATAVKSIAGRSLIEFFVAEHTGANVGRALSADDNVFGVRAARSGGNETLWIVDADGDTWQDGGIIATTATFSDATIRIAEAPTGGGLAGDAAGTAGDIAWGSSSGVSFLYVCTSANSWMRATLNPF